MMKTTTFALIFVALLGSSSCLNLGMYKHYFKTQAKNVDICPEYVGESCCEAFEEFAYALEIDRCPPADGSDDRSPVCADFQAIFEDCSVEDILGICSAISAIDDDDDSSSDSCDIGESGSICGISLIDNPKFYAFATCGEENAETDTDTDTETDTDTDFNPFDTCDLLEFALHDECVIDGCPDPTPDESCCNVVASLLAAGCDEDESTDSTADTDTDRCIEFNSLSDYYFANCLPAQDCDQYPSLPSAPMCCTPLRHKVGDGECDLALNTPECAYDGGDCCEDSCVPTLNECGTGAAGFQCRDPDQSVFPCATYAKGVRDNCGDCFPVVSTSAPGCCQSSQQYIDGMCSLFEDVALVTNMPFNAETCSRTCESVEACHTLACETCDFSPVEENCMETIGEDQCHDTSPSSTCCSSLETIFDDQACLPTVAYTNPDDLPEDNQGCANGIQTWGQLRAPCLVRVLRSTTVLEGLSAEDLNQALIDAFGQTLIDQLGVPPEAYVFFGSQAAEEKAAGDAEMNYGILEITGVNLSNVRGTLTNTDLTAALNTAFQAIDPSITITGVSSSTSVSSPPTTTPTTSPASLASPSFVVVALLALAAAMRF